MARLVRGERFRFHPSQTRAGNVPTRPPSQAAWRLCPEGSQRWSQSCGRRVHRGWRRFSPVGATFLLEASATGAYLGRQRFAEPTWS